MPGRKKGRKNTRGDTRKRDRSPAAEPAKGVGSAAASALETAQQLHKEAQGLHERSHQVRLTARSLRKQTGKRPKGTKAQPDAADKKSLRERLSAPDPAAVSPGSEPHSALPFTVVGIGASAGGYEAATELLAEIPADIGLAFVLVQHLDPHHQSHLAELLAKSTALQVVEIRHNQEVEPNCVYVIPANTSVTLSGGRLRIGPRDPKPNPMPIDTFFRSLANEQQNRAIGIVLSGSGTDGSLGLVEIKGLGGLTIAQNKATAIHFGMPGSAIAAGAVDLVLSPLEIAAELKRLATHPYITEAAQAGKSPQPVPPESPKAESLFSDSPENVRTLFGLLRSRKGVDFSLYKPGTLNRRIMRRMALHKIDTLAGYVSILENSAEEIEALFHDLLINVTGFFRDAASFATLTKRLLPRLLKGRPDNVPIRVWTCGCATGEEAYSLAIAVTEFLEKAGKHMPVQIFASDLNDRAIERARTGVYHENILLDVSPERLRRFFVRVDGFYQVRKHIRDLCVFARQNVMVDPPFSNLDLISCRNVLIYLTPVLQKRIMPVFHYALKPGGFLMLGSSETTGDASELFELVDKKNKIYIKKATTYRPTVEFQKTYAPQEPPSTPARSLPEPAGETLESQLQHKVDRLILTEFSPTGVVINAQMDVLQFRGKTGTYLEHQAGTASLNLLKMIRDDLTLDVRRAVNKAVQTGDLVTHLAEVVADGRLQRVRIAVHPLSRAGQSERFFLVLFEEVAAEEEAGREKKGSKRIKVEAHQVQKLRMELASTKESLQAIIEEQEATNEELKSANEEIQSSNEELQSTNEELETAREELQSTNEELTTLNQELQNRNTELGQVNNDLTNLLTSVNIAIIMLGIDLKIRRFTPTAEKLFNLIPSDVGRKLSDLNRNLQVPDLDQEIRNVIENLTVVEREVQDREGRWYSLRIRPYRTRESLIDGVVLVLLDIDELKRSIRHIISLVRQPVAALTADLRVSRVNDAFASTFQITPEEAENKSIYELGRGQWNIPRLRQLLEEILPSQGEVRDFRLEHEFANVGKRRLMINARRFYEEGRGLQLILLAIEDVTAKK